MHFNQSVPLEREDATGTVRWDSIQPSMMSLERVVAAPFQESGTSRLTEQEFVVALSLHRDWFSPDQSKRVVELATSGGLLERQDGKLSPAFDHRSVDVPGDFAPDEDALRRRSTFEHILETLTEEGYEKRETVGEINRLQEELHLTIEATAAVYASREGVPCDRGVDRAIRELSGHGHRS